MKTERGFIYILTNPSFKGKDKEYVKIGFAKDVVKRVNDLNHSTAIPYAYRIYATYETPMNLSDKELHKLIDSLNPELRTTEVINGKTRTREFYVMRPEDAYNILECIARISGTENRLKKYKMSKEDKAEAKEANTKRVPFQFSMIGLKPGTEIIFEDGKTKAIVVNDKKIEVNGEVMSLSKATAVLRNEFHRPFGGPIHWYYKGKKLDQIRIERGL